MLQDEQLKLKTSDHLYLTSSSNICIFMAVTFIHVKSVICMLSVIMRKYLRIPVWETYLHKFSKIFLLTGNGWDNATCFPCESVFWYKWSEQNKISNKNYLCKLLFRPLCWSLGSLFPPIISSVWELSTPETCTASQLGFLLQILGIHILHTSARLPALMVYCSRKSSWSVSLRM